MSQSEGQKARRPGRRDVSAGYGSYAVTPDDNNVLPVPARSLYVTVGGAVCFVGDDGEVDTWTVPDNFVIPVCIKQVKSTGTTATGIKAIV